jgi:phosphate-selective porin OprO/OprP
LKVGHFKTPVFMEGGQISTRFMNFIDAPVQLSVMDLDREIGLMLHGHTDDKTIEYELGIGNGNGPNASDTGDQKDLFGRIALQPMAAGEGMLSGMRVAASVSTGTRNRGEGPVNSFTTAGGTTWLNMSTVTHSGNRMRFGAELVLLGGGPIRIQGEYTHLRLDDVRVGGNQDDLSVNSWYMDVMYMLTGEDHPVGKRVKPDSVFDPMNGGWGAWQVGMRMERVDVEHGFARRNLGAGNAGRQNTDDITAMTLGINWYLNDFTRFMFNYQRVWFDDRLVDSGTNGNQRHVKKNEDVFFVRMAIDF